MVEVTFVVLLSFVLAVVFSMSFTEVAASTGGFRIELIHRDSPLSPFYNHSETDSDRFSKSILRSMSRADHISTLLSSTNLDTSTATIQSQLIPGGGSYLMKFSIGTPPTEVLAAADTGSDLIWTQCKPCVSCYKQDRPVFDPETSSTYRGISCQSTPCQSLGSSVATCENNACEYAYAYGNEAHHSQTNGILATETFTFDSTDQIQRTVSIPTLVFGCGHTTTGKFSSHGPGLVGLGGGPLSLVSQLGSKIDGKFSYCLANLFDDSASSKLNFGSQAIISGGNNVVSTPLITKHPVAYYYLTLEAISISGKRLENKQMNNFGGNNNNIVQGNIVIDSGTTLTMLPPELYNQVESTLREAIPLGAVQQSSGTLKLCYNAQTEFKIPDMIFHFTGADVRLPSLNTFVRFSDLVCLTIIPANDIVPIFGNLAQINFLIQYDLVGRKVSFAPADCNKY